MASGILKINDPASNCNGSDEDNIFVKQNIRPLSAINCSDFVVAHSTASLRPVRQFSEVNLLPHILETMQKLGLNRLRRVQSHTWPYLIGNRGRGAMIVSGPRSGRTFSYIPPVCDVVCRTIEESQGGQGSSSSLDLVGVLAMILVPDLERVRHVTAVFHALLRKVSQHHEDMSKFTLTLNVPSLRNPEFFHRLFNGVACLIATPAQMIWIWKEMQDLIQFPNLKFVIHDDVDLMDPEMVSKVELMIKKLVPNDRIYPQLVVTSQTYIPGEMRKLKLMNDEPALIFGDILEAALYGKTRIRIALRLKQDKLNEVLKMLQLRPPMDYTTMIYCSDDNEMRCLVGYLEVANNYSCLPYYQNANMEVRERVHEWLKKSSGTILLATDNCPELCIRNAHTLIHYGMSTSWSKFKMRFLAIAGNLTDTLNRDRCHPLVSGLSLYSLVLLDDSNQKQLPRLVDFLEKHQPMDDAILTVAKQIRQEEARLRSNQNVLCRQIMMLGDCIQSECDERHHTELMDRRPGSVPALTGDIKVKLVRVYSPTHLCVHILEHLPGPGQGWRQAHKRCLPAQHMHLQLLQTANSTRLWPPAPGAICLYRNAMNFKERVRVLKVGPIENVNLSDVNVEVLLQAMDLDTRIFNDRSGRLYECPELLQAEPPLAMDLRLFGIVPQSGERDWSEEERRAIEYDLKHLPEECFLQASVQFATSHTVFARSLSAILYGRALKLHMRILDLGQHLITAKMGRRCQQTKDKILAFFEDMLEAPGNSEVGEVLLKAEQEKEPVEEETKENYVPNRPALQGHENVDQKLKQQQEAAKEAEDMATKLEPKSKKEEEDMEPKEQKPNQDQALSQLYQCMMNCAILHNEDKTLPTKMREQVLSAESKFLDDLMNGPSSDPSPSVDKRKKKRKRKTTTPAMFKAAPRDPQKMQLQLPPNVIRPPTTYYQTQTTLELQVMLPDDGFKYSALLHDKQIFFHANHPASILNHAFTLPLGVAYSKLEHRMNGRTVYVTVKKTVGRIDPLHYHAYSRFLKPNHEKFGLMAASVEKNKAEMFRKYGHKIVYKSTRNDEEDGDTSEVESDVDGTERPETYVVGED